MRIILAESLQHQAVVVDLKHRSGLIVERIAVNASGELLGKVVGGQNGLDKTPFPFRQEDIVAYRKRGIAKKLGIAKWHST